MCGTLYKAILSQISPNGRNKEKIESIKTQSLSVFTTKAREVLKCGRGTRVSFSLFRVQRTNVTPFSNGVRSRHIKRSTYIQPIKINICESSRTLKISTKPIYKPASVINYQ